MGAAPDYDLPTTAIAQVPAEPRDTARLLVDRGPGRPPRHQRVVDLAGLVGPGDVLVLNDTRVLPARLRARKPSGGAVEVLLIEGEGARWEALVRPGRRVPDGMRLEVAPDLAIVVEARLPGGRRRVFLDGSDPLDAVQRHGELALPPYIHAPPADPDRYQTTYARVPGSVAAPTAGLHLTAGLLDRCRSAGASVVSVDLAVGLDTFRPVTADHIEDHPVHGERYRVSADVMDACRRAERVVAVGTTTVRALETAATTGTLEGRSHLLITPGYRWKVVDLLLTNFHQPRSTLLLLVEALIGERWRALYEEALAEGYKFLSFGDAMLLRRAASSAGEDGSGS